MWRSDNRLDGKRTHLLTHWKTSALPALFLTRKEARQFIESEYGYLRERHDLKAEPHGWKMPLPVRVRVSLLRR